MAKTNKAVNAGVHGASGLEFQKHCALYVLFDRYSALKEKNYFICLEHHEDFIFCYKDDKDLVISIDAFQAKKASTPWGMEAELFELIHKITSVGLDLISDEIPKSEQYNHSLAFVTNNSISLTNGKKKPDAKSATINESNNHVVFSSLDVSIRDKIIEELRTRQLSLQTQIDELQNFSLMHFDLPKTTASQKDTLVGLFDRIFGSKIINHRAAVETLLALFRDAENFINQGNIAKLMDEKKRVSSATINLALQIINSQQKAFDLWRSKEDEISEAIVISVMDRENFKLQFNNSFDLFKDLKQTEHRNIYSFVLSMKAEIATHVSHVKCVEALYESFKKSKTSKLNPLDIKAAIFAAYIEVKDQP